jgi:hypothetical protein
MSAPSIPLATPGQWPTDVVALAQEKKLDQYLDPLLKATWQLFPTASQVNVAVELDPELRDERSIVFNVLVARADGPDFGEAMRRWHQEEDKIIPPPRSCTFVLSLEIISP